MIYGLRNLFNTKILRLFNTDQDTAVSTNPLFIIFFVSAQRLEDGTRAGKYKVGPNANQ